MTASTSVAARPVGVVIRRRAVLRVGWLAAAVLVLVAVCLASVAFGTRSVALGHVVAVLIGDDGGDLIDRAAVLKRIPRTVLAVLVGSALAVSGATMQAITRNPLAEPGILGVSGGAALAVVVGVAFFGLSDQYAYMAVAVIGASIAAALVYLVGSLGRGGASPLKLALAGAAMTAAFSSVVNAILLPRVDVMSSFRFWQIGGVGGATWDRIVVVSPLLAAGLVICLSSARGLNALALGDDLASGLGTGVARTRVVAAVGAVVLCGVATSVAGPIAFVGLVVPHVCRLVVGSDHRWLLPFAALGGAVLLVGADVLGRVVGRPEELEVGIVTALVGAPVLVWVVRRQKLREL